MLGGGPLLSNVTHRKTPRKGGEGGFGCENQWSIWLGVKKDKNTDRKGILDKGRLWWGETRLLE